MGLKYPENGYYGNKKKYIYFFARKTLGATDLKVDMHIRHSGSNMGWVPPGHIPSLPCVRLKMPKMVYQLKHYHWEAHGTNLLLMLKKKCKALGIIFVSLQLLLYHRSVGANNRAAFK